MKLLVSGLGRCGSTLIMKMLDAGGVPIYDKERLNELWEHPKAVVREDFGNVFDLSEIEGAVKLLDARRFVFPGGSCKSLFITRDPMQQALSMAKMLHALKVSGAKRQVKALATSLVVDEPLCLNALKAVGEVKKIRFENLINAPTQTAWEISCLTGGDWQKMAQVIEQRTVRASEDLRDYERHHVECQRR